MDSTVSVQAEHPTQPQVLARGAGRQRGRPDPEEDTMPSSLSPRKRARRRPGDVSVGAATGVPPDTRALSKLLVLLKRMDPD